MAMRVNLVTVEMSDGTVHEQVRVSLQDRLRMEKAARANGWKIGDANYSPSISAFLAWSALTRENKISCSYEQFTGGECADLELHEAEATVGDPTVTEATTVS